LPDGLTTISGAAFYQCGNITLKKLPEGITSIGNNAFNGCTKLALAELPSGITSIGTKTFYACNGLTTLTFNSKPTIASDSFSKCTNLTTINVPWAEGEVANAPWGATNATINYNYTEE
jgi:hypothetical protein